MTDHTDVDLKDDDDRGYDREKQSWNHECHCSKVEAPLAPVLYIGPSESRELLVQVVVLSIAARLVPHVLECYESKYCVGNEKYHLP